MVIVGYGNHIVLRPVLFLMQILEVFSFSCEDMKEQVPI